MNNDDEVMSVDINDGSSSRTEMDLHANIYQPVLGRKAGNLAKWEK